MRAILVSLLAVSSAFLMGACSSDNTSPATTPGSELGYPIEIACNDTIDSIYQAPPDLGAADPGRLGEIIRCAHDRDMTAAQLLTEIESGGEKYTGKPFTSGARVYRILYRTTRGNDAVGYSSGLVYLPTVPREAKMPMVVVSHGSIGGGPGCATSWQGKKGGEGVWNDFAYQAYPLVALGFPIVATDFAGYANFGAADNPPPTYASGKDLAYSSLDSSRALKRLIPSSLTDKVFFSGHSQGGHATLSSLAFWESYAPELNLAGVAVYSPNWVSQAVFGGAFLLASSYPVKGHPNIPNAASLWYHYSHAYMLDGAEHAMDMFAESKRDAIKTWIDKACWVDPQTELENIASETGTIKDFFDPAFQAAVQAPAGLGTLCTTTPGVGQDYCKKWLPRYKEDRAKITGKALSVPLMWLYGGQDTSISPPYDYCGIEKVRADGATPTLCLEPNETHVGIVLAKSGYVGDWMANLALGGPAVAPCTSSTWDIIDPDKNAVAVCASIPPNKFETLPQ